MRLLFDLVTDHSTSFATLMSDALVSARRARAGAL